MSNASPQNRPYRSHKVPACDRCRQRKARCIVDIPGQACFLCRDKGIPCSHAASQRAGAPGAAETEMATGTYPLHRAKRRLSQDGHEEGGQSTRNVAYFRQGLSAQDSAFFVGPADAEDIEILGRHITGQPERDLTRREPYQTISQDSRNPVIYLNVPRYRAGLSAPTDPGRDQLEILSHLMGPLRNEVVTLYLDYIYPHFPVIDDSVHLLLRKRLLDQIPPVILCMVLAVAIPLWPRSDNLKLHPKPEDHFAWKQAITALNTDFLAPSYHTIVAACNDLIGRPSLAMLNNILNTGRVAALAQSFGLHRDPSAWKISEHEKTSRIRLWWGVQIVAQWASIAYGTPPSIITSYRDVPLPKLRDLAPENSGVARERPAAVFIQLCSLTNILGDLLPLVYRLEIDLGELAAALDQLQARLHDWSAQLPDWIREAVEARRSCSYGGAYLCFSFLTMRLLINRLALRRIAYSMTKPAKGSGNDGSGGEPSGFGGDGGELELLSALRDNAAELLDFVSSLTEREFGEFWLPYTSHLLISGTLIYLRCITQAQSASVRAACAARLSRFRTSLQRARKDYGWELADLCLERCSASMARVIEACAEPDARNPAAEGQTNGVSNSGSDDPTPTVVAAAGAGQLAEPLVEIPESHELLPSFMNPGDDMQYPWDTMWDTTWSTFEEMPSFF